MPTKEKNIYRTGPTMDNTLSQKRLILKNRMRAFILGFPYGKFCILIGKKDSKVTDMVQGIFLNIPIQRRGKKQIFLSTVLKLCCFV